MDRYPISASSLEKFYYVDGHQLERQYREHLSGYPGWEEADHAGEWLVFPENVGPNMSIDETSLSDGELYTVLTNKDAHGRKGTLAAIVPGTKAEAVREALEHIPEERRDMVTEVTMDLSSSMRNIAVMEFRNAKRTVDRFHVQKLALDAVQEMRIGHRWEALGGGARAEGVSQGDWRGPASGHVRQRRHQAAAARQEPPPPLQVG